MSEFDEKHERYYTSWINEKKIVFINRPPAVRPPYNKRLLVSLPFVNKTPQNLTFSNLLGIRWVYLLYVFLLSPLDTHVLTPPTEHNKKKNWRKLMIKPNEMPKMIMLTCVDDAKVYKLYKNTQCSQKVGVGAAMKIEGMTMMMK